MVYNYKNIKKYRQTEKGKESLKKSQKKYNQSEKGKEIIKKSQKKYNQSEKGKEARKKSNLQPASIERRKKWENSEQGKEKRRIIRNRYILKMKIQKAKSKLSFEQNYFLNLFLLLFFR